MEGFGSGKRKKPQGDEGKHPSSPEITAGVKRGATEPEGRSLCFAHLQWQVNKQLFHICFQKLSGVRGDTGILLSSELTDHGVLI